MDALFVSVARRGCCVGTMILEDNGGFWSTLSSLTKAASLLEKDVWRRAATGREENHSLGARNGGKRTKRVVYSPLEGEGMFESRV